MIFKHDCDTCRFLGTVTGPNPRMAVFNPTPITFDLYYCATCDGGTVIARYSDVGSYYSSCPVNMLHKEINPALLWAYALLQMEKMAEKSQFDV